MQAFVRKHDEDDKQQGVWCTVIKAVPAVKPLRLWKKMREDRRFCITFVEICFHRLVVLARTRDIQLRLNKTPVMPVQYFKAKKIIHKYLSKILVLFVILIITFSVQLSVMHFVVLDS